MNGPLGLEGEHQANYPYQDSLRTLNGEKKNFMETGNAHSLIGRNYVDPMTHRLKKGGGGELKMYHTLLAE